MAELAALATSPAPELTSSFRASYNLAVNLVRRYRADQAYDVLDRSFAQFLNADHHDALSRRMDRALRPARAPGPRRPRRLAADRRAGPWWPGSTTSPICWWPRPWPMACSTTSTPPGWPPWSRPAPSRSGRGAGSRSPVRPGTSPPGSGALVALGESLRVDEEASRLGRTRLPDLGLRRGGLALGPGRAPGPGPRAGRAGPRRLRPQRQAAGRPPPATGHRGPRSGHGGHGPPGRLGPPAGGGGASAGTVAVRGRGPRVRPEEPTGTTGTGPRRALTGAPGPGWPGSATSAAGQP